MLTSQDSIDGEDAFMVGDPNPIVGLHEIEFRFLLRKQL
jgi:hypothetical protein